MTEQLTIGELISWIESRNDSGAIRFEPGTYNKFAGDISKAPKAARDILERIRIINACSLHTAAMIYSTSWGMFQSMGFNIYANPSTTTISEYLSSPRLQAEQFVAFLKRTGLQDFTPTMLAKDQASRFKFSMKYNGSIVYDSPMCAALRHFGISVVVPDGN
jgi:hypothetical protein